MLYVNSGRALNAYRSVSVESIAASADAHQLVLMLFNGARAALAGASGHLQRREIAAKCKAISSAIEIIDLGLKASLDLNVGGELAQNLFDLYDYMARRLFYANLKNDRSALDEVARLLEQLGGAWEAIAAKPLTAAAAAPSAVAPSSAVAAPSAAVTQAASPPPINRVAAAYGMR
jgi:flagellar protein FliS